MNTDLIDLTGHDAPIVSPDALIARARLIEHVYQEVMKENVHYGKIPGCGDKPALLKPGAEKLASTFRLAIEPIATDLSGPDSVRYRVEARGTSMLTGAYCGSGIGECSSDEDKYKWKRAASEDEFVATPEDRRRIKHTSSGKTKQIRTNPADLANTILKMASKRAKTDLVLTVLGCSDIFEQDLDEDEVADQARENREEKKEPLKEPKSTEHDPALISDPQRKRLYAIMKGAGWTDEAFKALLLEQYQLDSTTKIPKTFYEEICKLAEAGNPRT